MKVEDFKLLDEDSRKAVVYSVVILSIAKIEKIIKEYEKDIEFCKTIDSQYLLPMITLQCKQRKTELKNLKKFKAKIENGEFDRIKEEQDNE